MYRDEADWSSVHVPVQSIVKQAVQAMQHIVQKRLQCTVAHCMISHMMGQQETLELTCTSVPSEWEKLILLPSEHLQRA